MGAVTYPDARVSQLLEESFHCVRVNIREPQPEMRPLLRQVKAIWAPLFLFLDPRGTELRRYTGWLAPEEFLAELHFVLGMQDLLRQRLAEAFRRFRTAVDDYPQSSVAPEALFWAGAVAYKRDDRSLESLRLIWDDLQRRYPQSTWARRADVWDMLQAK